MADSPGQRPRSEATQEPALDDLDSHTRQSVRNTRKLMEQLGKMDKFSLGDFFSVLFNHSDRLSKSIQGSITQWLSAHTRDGTRPAEIFNAIYRHPHSLKHQNYEPKTAGLKSLVLPERPSSARSDRAVSFLPPGSHPPSDRLKEHVKELYNSRQGLEEWAARAMLFRANKEANILEDQLSPGDTLSWDAIRSFSIKEEQKKMKEKAPMLWATLSQVALNVRRLARRNRGSADISQVSTSDSESDSDSEDSGDDELEGMSPEDKRRESTLKRAKRRTDKARSAYMIDGTQLTKDFRQHPGHYFLSLGIGTDALDVFRALSTLGLSPSYNTVRERLKSLAAWAKTRLKEIGQQAYQSSLDDDMEPRFFMFNFDNINKYITPRAETVGNKGQMRSGTAATIIMLEDVPRGAFRREPYIRNIEAGQRRELTVDTLYKDIDQEHLANAGTGIIMKTLAKNISGLKHLRSEIEDLFQDPSFCAVHRLRLRKSRIHPLGTSGINESTVSGASDVIDDLVDQMGMQPSWFDNLLIPVGGDQLSVDRTRRAIGYLDQEESIRYQKSWALPMIQPWHMGWAYMKKLMDTHWYEQTGKKTLGLRRSVGALGRQLSPETWDYYPTLSAISVVFSTMVLSTARNFLQQNNPGATPPSHNEKAPQLLEELEWFFSSVGPACEWSLDDLRGFSRCLYDEYLTTEGHQRALAGTTVDQPTTEEVDAVLMHNMLRQLQLSTDAPVASSSRTRRGRNVPTVIEDDKSLLSGDQVIANGKLFMQDAFYLLEFVDAMKDGDPGRMMKIMDVLCFAFWGSGSSNYGAKLLELACNFKFEYPAPLKQAILNNYLVNPSGLPKHWQAGDLLQEHFNDDIKNIFNSKNLDFDTPFMRESIALNIAGFADIKETVPALLGLAPTGKRHAAAQYRSDINVLGAHFATEDFFKFTPKQPQPYSSRDMIAAGYTKLKTGSLQAFLDRTLGDRTAVRDEDGTGGEADIPNNPSAIIQDAPEV